jgi:hypothetical protein
LYFFYHLRHFYYTLITMSAIVKMSVSLHIVLRYLKSSKIIEANAISFFSYIAIITSFKCGYQCSWIMIMPTISLQKYVKVV